MNLFYDFWNQQNSNNTVITVEEPKTENTVVVNFEEEEEDTSDSEEELIQNEDQQQQQSMKFLLKSNSLRRSNFEQLFLNFHSSDSCLISSDHQLFPIHSTVFLCIPNHNSDFISKLFSNKSNQTNYSSMILHFVLQHVYCYLFEENHKKIWKLMCSTFSSKELIQCLNLYLEWNLLDSYLFLSDQNMDTRIDVMNHEHLPFVMFWSFKHNKFETVIWKWFTLFCSSITTIESFCDTFLQSCLTQTSQEFVIDYLLVKQMNTISDHSSVLFLLLYTATRYLQFHYVDNFTPYHSEALLHHGLLTILNIIQEHTQCKQYCKELIFFYPLLKEDLIQDKAKKKLIELMRTHLETVLETYFSQQ